MHGTIVCFYHVHLPSINALRDHSHILYFSLYSRSIACVLRRPVFYYVGRPMPVLLVVCFDVICYVNTACEV